jgi:Fic family protein
MSSQIREERKAYYEILEATQKGGMDVSRLPRPCDRESNERQKMIINRLLDGFEGKLTTERWAKLAKTSHDTALRDIQDLIEKRILKQDKAGGRSTAYALSTPLAN